MMEISKYSGTEILEKLNSGEISLLESLGADELKREMNFAGLFCRILVGYICQVKAAKLRSHAITVLKVLTPVKKIGDFPQVDTPIVVGFNHPSLGEIFRLLLLAFNAYPDREFLFPVNLPWYEAMIPIIPKLSMLGIHITPMITPSTEKKLMITCRNDPATVQRIQHFKILLERLYIKAAIAAAEKNYVIFVAPSATRQAEVIGEYIHPAMTFLSHMLYRNNENQVLFLPVAVIEPKNSNKRLNLFRKYLICPCIPFERAEIEAIPKSSRAFDYNFLLRIDSLRKEYLK